MTRMVAITDYDFGEVEVERRIVEGAGFGLAALQCRSEDELVESAADAVALLTQYARVGARAIAGLPGLRHIARYGTGVDIVDVDAATAAGVLVTNVPADYCLREVADHALAMVLYFARRLRAYDEATHAGTWAWQAAAPIHGLHGARLGIVGLGTIGRAIARRATCFDLDVVAFDPFLSAEQARSSGATMVDFDTLLGTSDYVVIQAPLTGSTRALFGPAAIGRMKRGAVLVNTARGPIVDSAALYDALRSGHLAGAALDDLPEEPAKARGWVPDNPLFTLPNCLITPHVAYYSEESMRYARRFAAEEVVRVLRGERPCSPVNTVAAASSGTEARP
jgi:D-3-phosphoglycerate dehydrogenase / 2-oxoglutarate reductase